MIHGVLGDTLGDRFLFEDRMLSSCSTTKV